MRVWVFILVFVMLTLSPVLASAQCTPPLSGDWSVNTTIVCSSDFITLNGDLIINGSGNLTFDSSTLQFNSTTDGEYGIDVDGTLYVLRTKIESNSTHAYTFVSNPGAKLEIRNSEIHDCGYGTADFKKRGIYIESMGSQIINTTFSQNYMALLIFSNNNNIFNNKIFSNSGGLRGIGSVNIISRNTIKYNTNSGLDSVTGENIVIEHNLIENNTGTVLPVFTLNNSVINNNSFINNTQGSFRLIGRNNNVTNNRIVSNYNSAGVELKNSENTRIEGNNILQNKYGLYLEKTKTTTLKDTRCNQSSRYDIYMLSAESTTFDNTSYSSIIKRWYLNVTVVNNESNPLSGAKVVIKNNFTKTVFSGNTNSYGMIARRILNETIQNSSGTYNFTPYRINVTKTNYTDNFTTFSLTGDTFLTIYLNATQIITPPPPPPSNETFTFTIISPKNATYLSGNLTVNGTIELRVISGKNISSCNYTINNFSGTVKASGSLSKVNSKNFRSYLNVSGMQGLYKANFVCDSLENITNSSSVFFSLYPSRECLADGHCASIQICTDWACVNLTCECGYAANHGCTYYECCEDSDCEDDEQCNPDTHVCELVPCACPEKRSNHECTMTPDYCCLDAQCDENETCIDNECVESTLSFSIPQELVLGQNISVLVVDKNGDPVETVKIIVKYLDTDPFVSETYYTDDSGLVSIPIKHAGRVEFVARKPDFFLAQRSGEVPEPFNFLFLIQIIVLLGAVAGIAIVWFKFIKGGRGLGLSIGIGRGPLKLEKTISGSLVMLKIKNTTKKKAQDITIRDSVPRGSFINSRIMPKIEPFDRLTDILTWEILTLEPNEEVIIEYRTRRANPGFSVNFGNKEYKA